MTVVKLAFKPEPQDLLVVHAYKTTVMPFAKTRVTSWFDEIRNWLSLPHAVKASWTFCRDTTPMPCFIIRKRCISNKLVKHRAVISITGESLKMVSEEREVFKPDSDTKVTVVPRFRCERHASNSDLGEADRPRSAGVCVCIHCVR